MLIKFPIVSKYGSLVSTNKIIYRVQCKAILGFFFKNRYMDKQFKSIVLSRIYQILILCHEGLSQWHCTLSHLHYAKKIVFMNVSRKAIY